MTRTAVHVDRMPIDELERRVDLACGLVDALAALSPALSATADERDPELWARLDWLRRAAARASRETEPRRAWRTSRAMRRIGSRAARGSHPLPQRRPPPEASSGERDGDGEGLVGHVARYMRVVPALVTALLPGLTTSSALAGASLPDEVRLARSRGLAEEAARVDDPPALRALATRIDALASRAARGAADPPAAPPPPPLEAARLLIARYRIVRRLERSQARLVLALDEAMRAIEGEMTSRGKR